MVQSVALILAALLVSGCADLARWMRQSTYPPEFRYLEREEVAGIMRQLAAHSRQLNQLLRQDQAPAERRSEIIAHLRAMEEAAERLDLSGWETNHPKLDMNLPSFRRDLKFAREAVEREPPNFLVAAPVTGACAHCHSER